mmetsp:Transcript_10304/g.28436  ORF Transcript_10304/g.28436 Transcript_10304/m.28436 type:complete len:440 (+) Transcript_10304:26-1345(+)
MDDDEDYVPEAEPSAMEEDEYFVPKAEPSADEDFVPEAEPSADEPVKAKSGNRRKRPRPNLNNDDFYESEEDQKIPRRGPAYARRTERGGYSHTADSRQKIGMANKGNVPWNKGKNRSDGTKSKIGAGVRARNHRILMANLEQINMTEEEYRETRSKIKYVRERVRKGRINNRQRVEKERAAKAKLEDYWNNIGQEKEEEEEEPEEAVIIEEIIEETDEEEEQEEEEVVALVNQEPSTTTPIPGALEQATTTDQGNNISQVKVAGGTTTLEMSSEHMPSVFRRDIVWNHHFYDNDNSNTDAVREVDSRPEQNFGLQEKEIREKEKQQTGPEPYKMLCPTGGPGGLICCSICTANYSKFMMETEQNLENQETEQLGWETTTLVHLLKQTKRRLQQSIPAARKVPPPVVPTRKKPPPPVAAKQADSSEPDNAEENDSEGMG